MRLLTVVGTRPQLIKYAELSHALRSQHEEWFVDTGQHYDDGLAGSMYRHLAIPDPVANLEVGSGTRAEQVSRVLLGVERIVQARRPDAIVVIGDTNSTLGGALAAEACGLPCAHVEAGVRSYDRQMPEETNRVVADHLSTWLFAPDGQARENLANEGIRNRVFVVGDLMYDFAARTAIKIGAEDLTRISSALPATGVGAPLHPGGFLFATVHRGESRLEPNLRALYAAFGAVAQPGRPLVLALHPGTAAAAAKSGLSLPPEVIVTPPLPYRSSLALALFAAAVLTDSGGLQRECAWLGTPCLILRTTTEWRTLVEESSGRSALVGFDARAIEEQLALVAPAGEAEDEVTARVGTLSLASRGTAMAIAEAIR